MTPASAHAPVFDIAPAGPINQVLIIGEDAKQNELYSDLIREVADCKVDVVSRVESQFGWLGRSNYHLVLIDASQATPGVSDSGVQPLELLERIKRISPQTSVIVISEQATIEDAVAAIRMGAEDYLKRPFTLESLQLAVKRGLDRKYIFGESSGASSYLNLLNSCQMISATLEQDKIFKVIRSYLSIELGSALSAIYKWSREAQQAVRLDEGAEDGSDAPGARTDRATEELLQIALHASNPIPALIAGSSAGQGNAAEFYRFVERSQLTPGLFLFRFRCVGDVDYICVCLSPERPGALDAFEGRLRMLRAQIEATGKNIEKYLGVQHLVYVDDATGLYNTRYLNYVLDREIKQSLATQKSFAILFIDADKFKGINDSHGHLIGTRLLNELGASLRKLVRDQDTVFRYGGDEFVAVLSPADLGTAKRVAERIRETVEGSQFLKGEGLELRFTVSIGVALFPDHATSKRAVIEAADHAMYAAKRKTRNSVFIAELAAPPADPSGSDPSQAA